MTRDTLYLGVGAFVIVGLAAVGYVWATATVPSDLGYIQSGHVVYGAVDYGPPGEAAFTRIARDEKLDEEEPAAARDRCEELEGENCDEVHKVGRLYCQMRAQHPEISAEDMVQMAVKEYARRYRPSASADEVVMWDAAAATAAKSWCPTGYMDASLTGLPE